MGQELKSDILEQDSPTIQAAAKILIKQYSSPTKPKWGLGGADPFVIAHAQTAAPKRIVVSGEKGDQNNPKIKYVCDQIGLTCVSFRSF